MSWDFLSGRALAQPQINSQTIPLAGTFNVVVAHIEEKIRVLPNLVEEPEVAADAGVPHIRARPLSGS